ncbi:FAD-dependent monooxygenase [Streptomyces sp. NPDC093252]|uniref:FAD-dependent monooxygenase n=1 Tax=Streptomyces sp. NPDC093252 TaxID=3154980 RepID=UPI00342B2A60
MQENGTDHDVVIVGAGPTGTLLAIELGRRGIDVRVVERRRERLRHPRASGIHARTMELFRQLDLGDEIRRASGLPSDDWSRYVYLTRLNRPPLGVFDQMLNADRVAQARGQSPEMHAWCAQDRLEDVLRKRLRTFATVTLDEGVRATGITENTDSVELTLVDEATGAEETVSARYLVGADGGRSAVRRAAGIASQESPPLSHQVNVCFEADLTPYIGDEVGVLHWIVNPDTQGCVITYDGARQWVYSWEYDPETLARDHFTPQRCTDVIRAAVGVPDLDIRIRGTFFWQIDSALADSFGRGRVYLVGDAAHRFPPAGGFGMNSGLQDVQNLAWKLHEVLRGTASPDLLATYGTERRATAISNTDLTLFNARKTAEVGWILTDPDSIADIELPQGEATRRRIAEAIPGQEAQYWSYGQQFGRIYESAAVVPDGTPLPEHSVTDYRPSAQPGAHAPHVRLTGPEGRELSTIDLLHSRFVLLTPPAGHEWAEAARETARRRGIAIDTYVIGDRGDYTDPDGDWADCYGLGDTGAVLVRPDGHVAFRAPALSPDQDAAVLLGDVFARLFGTHPARALVKG